MRVAAAPKRGGNGKGRAIDDRHRHAVLEQIEAHAAIKQGLRRFTAIRARALYTLAWSSGIRLTEVLRLDCGDVLEQTKKEGRIVSAFELEARKAKGGKQRTIYVGRAARAALRAYMLELVARGDLDFTDPTWRRDPLFVTGRGRGRGNPGGIRMPKRAAQADWRRWQRAAQIQLPYRFHDLRHTAITRFAQRVGGDTYQVAVFAGHTDIRTSQRYTHVDPAAIAAAAEEL